MSLTLHAQLDRLENLMSNHSPPHDTRLAVDLLQRTSVSLYGQPVPESWLPAILNEPITPSSSIGHPSITELPVDQKGWSDLVKGPFRRPANKGLHQDLCSGLRAMEEKDARQFRWNKILGPINAILAASFLIAAALDFLHGHWQMGLIHVVPLSLNFAAAMLNAKAVNQHAHRPRLQTATGWLEQLGPTKISQEDVQRWSRYPSLATKVVAWEDSGVPLLVGDRNMLNKAFEHRKKAAKQERQVAARRERIDALRSVAIGAGSLA